MPIYVYRDEDGNHYEVQQSFHDDALEEYTDSSGVVRRVRRVFQPFMSTFVGGGWARSS